MRPAHPRVERPDTERPTARQRPGAHPAAAELRLPRRQLLLGSAMVWGAALLGCAAPAAAHGRWVDVQVIDRDSGTFVPQHRHRGRSYIAAVQGQRYGLQLRNLGGERLLVVLSVDGLNIVTGETASYTQSGYVLGPWQTLEVAGWRKSLDEVAGFEFSSLGQSYAARTGRPFDVGVIGAAVFRERRPPVAVSPWAAPPEAEGDAPPAMRRRLEDAPDAGAADRATPHSESAAQAPARSAQAHEGRTAKAPAPALRERLGTAHGEREHAPARHVAFERDSARPTELLALHYDSRPNLVALGVLPPARPRAPVEPSPFPGAPRPLGFVPDPSARPW